VLIEEYNVEDQKKEKIMIKRQHLFIFTIIILLSAALACSLGGGKDIPLGETFQSDVGGYIVQKVPDYQFEETFGMAIMMPEDAQQDVGPFIMVYGGLIEENKSTQAILDEMKAQAEFAEFSNPKQTRVDGIEGLLVEFSGEEGGQMLKGKLFVVAPFPSQEFYMTAISPEGRWKEIEPVYDAVLKSVKFIEAQPFGFGFEDWDWEEPFEDELDSASLGDVYQHAQGGFSFQKIAGYDFMDNFGIITMAKPGTPAYPGPAFTLVYQVLDFPMSTEDVLNMAMEDPYATYYTPENYFMDGVWGLLVDYDRTENGQTAQGRTFFSMITPTEYFTLDVVAPAHEWPAVAAMYDDLLASVKFSGSAADLPAAAGVVIRQWAVRAEASSEYSSTDYAAMQATGAPDVEACEENPLAWAPLTGDTEEYLILYYETPVNPTELVIYQSHNPSQVVEIQFVDTEGETWMLWYGDPQEVSSCPDVWTHTIELDEVFYTNKVVLWVDQSVLGLGWAEIDAVELVGYPQGAAGAPSQDQPPATQPPAQVPAGDVPTNYSGLMAGPVYQGWINIVIGETKEADLDRIMTIPGRKSTDSWKPRESHKQTYLFDMPWAGMTAYISVDTNGVVYKKNVTSNTHPDDVNLPSVNRAKYEELKAIYDRDKMIPYEVMANLLDSAGFLREQYVREDDGVLVSTFNWYNAAGDRIVGIFYDWKLTGMIGLNFIPAE
jgi:hypothetical protein